MPKRRRRKRILDPAFLGVAFCILASAGILGLAEWHRLAGTAGREATHAVSEANRELRLKVERLRGELSRSLSLLTRETPVGALRDGTSEDRSAEGLLFVADASGRLIHRGPVFVGIDDLAGFPWPEDGKSEIRPASDLAPWDRAGTPERWDEGALLIIADPSGYAGRYIHKEALLATEAKPLSSGPVSFHWTTRTAEGATLAAWGHTLSPYLPSGAAVRPGPGGLELSVIAGHGGLLLPAGLVGFALMAIAYVWFRRRKAPVPVTEADGGIQPGYWKAQDTIRRLQARVAASERALATPKGPLNGRNPVQLAALAHELRTPLNAILGFSEMMDREMLGPLGNETYRDYARSIQESGQTLANRVEDVLALAALDAGERRLKPKPGDLMEPVLNAASALADMADAHGVRLMFGQRAGVWANLDAEALGESVGLFLAAQIEDTPANGTVRIETVRAGAGGGPILLRLLDTGEGRLSLLAETAPGATPPMGALSPLRLTLARRLLEAMGSTVEIRSTPRQGNEIRIWLASAQTPVHAIDAA